MFVEGDYDLLCPRNPQGEPPDNREEPERSRSPRANPLSGKVHTFPPEPPLFPVGAVAKGCDGDSIGAACAE